MYFEIILSEGFRKNGGYVKDYAKKNLKNLNGNYKPITIL